MRGPAGSGLSSSAAITCSSSFATLAAHGLGVSQGVSLNHIEFPELEAGPLHAAFQKQRNSDSLPPPQCSTHLALIKVCHSHGMLLVSARPSGTVGLENATP